MNAYRALLAGSLLSAALASAVPATALAARELVSRATGADGAPMPGAGLATATRDGRFVLFSGPASAADTTAAADRTTFFLRDRETDTTTPVLRADGENGAIWSNPRGWTALDLSADGTKVLFSGLRQDGGTRTALYVRDVAAGTTTIVSWLPSGGEAFKLAGTARFINGGAGMLFGAADTDGSVATYTRELPSGTAKLFQAGVAPTSATADGQTITWRRPLLPAKRPVGSRIGTDSSWVAAYSGTAIGFTTKGQPPVLVARTTRKELAGAPASYCYDGGLTTDRTQPYLLTVNDTGTLLHKEFSAGSLSYDDTTIYAERTAQGEWTRSAGNTFPKANLSVFDLGETGKTWLRGFRPFASGYLAPLLGIGGTAASLPDLSSPIPDPGGHNRGFLAARLFAGDTGVLTGERELIPNAETGERPTEDAVYAYDPIVSAPAPTAPTAPSQGEGEILDDPSLTADITWADCPDDPIGTADQYVTAVFNTPFTSSKSAGTVTRKPPVVARDGNIRPSSKTTVTVKTFGITTWSKTLPGSLAYPSAGVTLPKPWLWLPQTVTIDTEIAGYYGTPAKHVVQTRSWMAWK